MMTVLVIFFGIITLCSTFTLLVAWNNPNRCCRHHQYQHHHYRHHPSSSLMVPSTSTSLSYGSKRTRCSATTTTTTTRIIDEEEEDVIVDTNNDIVMKSSSSGTTISSLVGRPIERSKYLDLLQWLQQPGNDAQISTKIDIQQSSLGDGCGVFVNSPVLQDELLFTIPRKLCLTLQDVKGDVDCGPTFTKLMDKAGPGGNTVVMAGYMAKEYLIHLEDVKEKQLQQQQQQGNEDENAGSASTTETTNSGGSKWGPYLDTLPWERGINNQEHCLFWDDNMIETLLRGSLCYNEATSLREEVDLAIRVLDSIVSKPIRLARKEITNDSGFRWPWEVLADNNNNNDEKKKGPPEGLADAIKGAFVCLLTRSFQDVRPPDDVDGETGDEEKLVPLLDLLQHSETPNVRHAMRTVDGTVEVRARCDIEEGSELFNQYRSEEEESMPYARFFTRFGFVPNVSEPIENLLRDKSSIFYPQKAEV